MNWRSCVRAGRCSLGSRSGACGLLAAVLLGGLLAVGSVGCSSRFGVSGSASQSQVLYEPPKQVVARAGMAPDPRWRGQRVLIVDAAGRGAVRQEGYEPTMRLLEAGLLELGRTPLIGHAGSCKEGCRPAAQDDVQLAQAAAAEQRADLILQIVEWPGAAGQGVLSARYVDVRSEEVLATVAAVIRAGSTEVSVAEGVGRNEFLQACRDLGGSNVAQTKATCVLQEPATGSATLGLGVAAVLAGLIGVANDGGTVPLLLLAGGVAGAAYGGYTLSQEWEAAQVRVPNRFQEQTARLRPRARSSSASVTGDELPKLVRILLEPLAAGEEPRRAVSEAQGGRR